MPQHLLNRVDARRIAVRAQLLDADRPPDLLTVVNRLAFLQLDPTAAVAPSADLVAWTRLGAGYRPDHLRQAVERDRTLFEHQAMVWPMADLGLHLAEMAAWPEEGSRKHAWLAANASFRQFVLDLLRDSGPLLSREVPDRSVVPWPSTGWTNNRNVTQMLELLTARGEVAVSDRVGRQRRWDLAERVYPADTTVVPADEARRMRDERRLRSLGIARASVVGEAGESAQVEGTSGGWRIDPAAGGQPFAGRTALLSPFDRLVHDRKRAWELFDFEYVLEMYVPKAKRRWGYFALPVLHHDQLIGKVDATADHKSSTLRVQAIHQDVPFTPAVTAAVDAELEALASWLGLAKVTVV
ncbi:crosslink repair DNA glycosylase YcaQ family protein [Micromonospora sp. NPDC050200]|uniref:DNA glycosylase AlkZ-like family protein n=1 Tax=Micromonospora sp. NPDC050200 TaxID=3155664 RepID=UPI0033D9AEFF